MYLLKIFNNKNNELRCKATSGARLPVKAYIIIYMVEYYLVSVYQNNKFALI